ncbi:MAG: GGDEF domain-containing protein [Acidobacteriota bacterium]|nr:GGDEF domain-containing protein [Acidobacteriota bacterium]
MKGSSESTGIDRLRALAERTPPGGASRARHLHWGFHPLAHLHLGHGHRARIEAHDEAHPAMRTFVRADSGPVGRGWLFRDVDRERMLDMDRRLEPVRRQTMIMLIVALLVSAPWVGAWTLAPVFVAAALFAIATWRSPSVRRPERVIFAAWVGSEVIIAASVALTGPSQVAIYSWLAIPVVTLPARFDGRPLKAGVLIALGLLVAVALGTDLHQIVHDPIYLIAPSAVIVGVTLLSTALMRSDLEHRDRCVIDELTGMLNRAALDTRSAELVQQSAISGEPVGLIVADVDHFKAINDAEGHSVGDAVLAEVAARIRKQLRAFDLVYRFGGEEFVVLVPGADLHETERLAQSLRRAVSITPVCGGRRATLSCGVSASVRGQPFAYDAVFGAADAALYEAKHRGRDRVCVATFSSPGSGPLITEAGSSGPLDLGSLG